ncbi:MAG: hypothetical protein E7345_04930 [Clostridiales bacterium]|nr:hypothetical protein [Clostridiales bacterium]
MTQEQRITKGTITIFILSIILLLCLGATTVLAYFAGNQSSNTTLVMGGPVYVTIVDKNNQPTPGQGNLIMNLKGDRQYVLPGLGIDMQAIAKIQSSDEHATPALLRAKLDISVFGLNEKQAKEVERQIRESMAECLTTRIDGIRDGWVEYEGDYYLCYAEKSTDGQGQEYIEMWPVVSDATGSGITFINGTFQFPYKAYTNEYSNVEITFKLTFQAIQSKLEKAENSIPNVKKVLDEINWETQATNDVRIQNINL